MTSLDRASRRSLDYEELLQKEHPIYKVRRYMTTVLYAFEQSGDRHLLDHVMTTMTRPLRDQKATEIKFSPWPCLDLTLLALGISLY